MHTVRTQTVVLLALTMCGFCSLGGCFDVPFASNLAGTWGGTLTYSLVSSVPDNPPITMEFTMSYTVTFSDVGEVDALGLPTGGGLEPMGGLAEVGDFVQFDIDYAGNTVTYTITVTDLSRTADFYSITLDINYSQTGSVNYTMTGTETISYSLLADGSLQVDFSLEMTGDVNGQIITQTATLTGTLTRQ